MDEQPDTEERVKKITAAPERQPERATVGHLDRGGNEGGASIYFVRLPDGYLIECGYNYGAKERAHALADLVNAYGWYPKRPSAVY